MRLSCLDRPASLECRVKRSISRILSGPPRPVFKVTSYRPEFFGRSFSKVRRQIMNGGGTSWTRGEKHLFVAFISARSHCRY